MGVLRSGECELGLAENSLLKAEPAPIIATVTLDDIFSRTARAVAEALREVGIRVVSAVDPAVCAALIAIAPHERFTSPAFRRRRARGRGIPVLKASALLKSLPAPGSECSDSAASVPSTAVPTPTSTPAPSPTESRAELPVLGAAASAPARRRSASAPARSRSLRRRAGAPARRAQSSRGRGREAGDQRPPVWRRPAARVRRVMAPLQNCELPLVVPRVSAAGAARAAARWGRTAAAYRRAALAGAPLELADSFLPAPPADSCPHATAVRLRAAQRAAALSAEEHLEGLVAAATAAAPVVDLEGGVTSAEAAADADAGLPSAAEVAAAMAAWAGGKAARRLDWEVRRAALAAARSRRSAAFAWRSRELARPARRRELAAMEAGLEASPVPAGTGVRRRRAGRAGKGAGGAGAGAAAGGKGAEQAAALIFADAAAVEGWHNLRFAYLAAEAGIYQDHLGWAARRMQSEWVGRYAPTTPAERALAKREWDYVHGAAVEQADGRDRGHEGRTLADFARRPQAREANLEPHHILALRLYTGPAYSLINAALRQRSPDFAGTAFVLEHAVLLLALARPPRDDGAQVTTARGVFGTMPAAFAAAYDAGDARGGDVVSDRAFMSTSASVDVAVGKYRGHTLFLLRAFKPQPGVLRSGAEVAWVSQFPDEAEVLYPPCARLTPIPAARRAAAPSRGVAVYEFGVTYEFNATARIPTIPEVHVRAA